jgi:hypothetical protein
LTSSTDTASIIFYFSNACNATRRACVSERRPVPRVECRVTARAYVRTPVARI